LDGAVNSAPAWSPDGQYIVLESSGGLSLARPEPSTVFTNIRMGWALWPDWQPIPGPERSDYKNAAQFCKAERALLGDSTFRQKYGGGANAYGKCVSGK
jgi:hypothetical protein